MLTWKTVKLARGKSWAEKRAKKANRAVCKQPQSQVLLATEFCLDQQLANDTSNMLLLKLSAIIFTFLLKPIFTDGFNYQCQDIPGFQWVSTLEGCTDCNQCEGADLTYVKDEITRALNDELERNRISWFQFGTQRRLLRSNQPTLVSKGRQVDERELVYVCKWYHTCTRRLDSEEEGEEGGRFGSIFQWALDLVNKLVNKLVNASNDALETMSVAEGLTEECKETLRNSKIETTFSLP